MTSPNPLREALQRYVEAAYCHALPVYDLDEHVLEPAKPIESTEWIIDSILTSIQEHLPSQSKYRTSTSYKKALRKMLQEAKSNNTVMGGGDE